MRFASRRFRSISIVLLAILLIWTGHQAVRVSLYQEQFLTGWILTAIILILVFYNIRKKISVLPIGSASTWLQMHIYLGLVSIFLFFLHTGWRFPSGWLESLLAFLFLGVSLSGVVGLYLNRRLSKLLTRRGEEIIFERIPGFISELRNQAEEVVLECANETSSSTLSTLYATHLAPFFAGPKNLFRHFRGSRQALFDLLKQTTKMDRYLNEKERVHAEKLRLLIEQKDELDYHYALQATLKGWLFIHVPLTYGMLVLITIHLVVAYTFSGGI